MRENKYSVLMSVYKNENPKYFKLSIESMINQTLKPNEIVIVKDGALTKELNEIINNFEIKYPNLFTIVNLKNNVGLGKALNEGLKKCKNELVARMDTDDISIDKRCELQIKEFENNNKLSIVGTIIDEFYDKPTDIISSRVVPINHEDILKFSRRRNPFNHPTVMYKKSEVLSCGGYGDYRRNQDFDLFVRMLNSGYVAKNINKSLLLFRANKDNLKRRKSWTKCRSNISMMHDFWKKGYSGLIDLFIVATSQIVVFISPIWLFQWISDTYLRKKY
ncbi:glycosyltransferase [Clostridium taeniosporum]|uniref:Glycosyl transferase n=1 Tax=Clostridium taeniosporum TaxID=394958 RepID=A0A1D7XN38_9CLOT|nr:glycosyltransferase [Clostridium taeniosporum]AOR24752.1 glycosyl transferase [Clostridium taeniosporum]